MLKLTLACYVLWQLLVILYQFSDSLRNRLAAVSFYSCGLLSTWRMFGPQPVDGDYLLFYRTAPDEATPFAEWQLLDYDKKAPIPFNLLFNPHANIVKALREISQEAIKSGSVNNVYYQLLLNDLIRQLRRELPTAAAELESPAAPVATAEPAGPQHKNPAPAATRKSPAPAPSRRLQFEIRWKTTTTLQPLFSSHVHPY